MVYVNETFSIPNHLRTDSHLLITGERKKCDNCILNVEATKFENHSVSKRHTMGRTKGLKKKPACETCNKDLNETQFI